MASAQTKFAVGLFLLAGILLSVTSLGPYPGQTVDPATLGWSE